MHLSCICQAFGVMESQEVIYHYQHNSRLGLVQVKILRSKHNWSQKQLAQMSGLSIRTIQRIENGENVGLETLKSLAAVFEVNVNELKEDRTMTPEINLSEVKSNSDDPIKQNVVKYKFLIDCAFSSMAFCC